MKLLTVNTFLLVSLIIKILLGYFIPVFGDEAYYYVWSLHPQLSYFDHPPMVSWFIYTGHLVFPPGNPLSLRFVFILASLLTSITWVKILRLKKLGEPSIILWLSLFFLNPLLGVGSILATPDTPLALFWSLTFLSFLNLLDTQKLSWYALTGFFLGLGFCSKYHIVLFVFSGLIYVVFSKKWRLLRPAGVLLTILVGALFSMPVILWNAQNNWSSFLFQLNHGFGEEYFEWAWPAGYLFAQLMIINPFITYSLFKKAGDSINRTFSLSQLLFFFSSSFKSVVEGNWPLTSHLHSITHFCESKLGLYRAALYYWLFFYGFAIVYFISPLSLSVKKNLVNSAQLEEIIPLTDIHKPLFGPSYQVASILSWKTQKNIPKLNGLSRTDFYDSLPDSLPVTSSFFVLKYDISEWPKKYEIYKKIKIQSFDNTSLGLYQFTHE